MPLNIIFNKYICYELNGVRTTRHIYKLAPNIQTCPMLKSPQFKLAPNTNSPHFIVYDKIQFVLVVFDHRWNVYPALQVMVLVNRRCDRSIDVMCTQSCQYAIELYWSLIVERYSTTWHVTTHVLSNSSERVLTQVEVIVKHRWSFFPIVKGNYMILI